MGVRPTINACQSFATLVNARPNFPMATHVSRMACVNLAFVIGENARTSCQTTMLASPIESVQATTASTSSRTFAVFRLRFAGVV